MNTENLFSEFFTQQDRQENASQDQPSSQDATSLREELLSLAEAGEIKQTPNAIKKANQDVLEKIMRDYKRKQTEAVNEYISGELISKLTDVMKSLEMVDNADDLEKELSKNKLLKNDLKNIVGQLTPYIPLIGLVCGAAIVGKHVWTRSERSTKSKQSTEEKPSAPTSAYQTEENVYIPKTE